MKTFGATTIGNEIRASNEKERERERYARNARKPGSPGLVEILSRIGDR